jgi:hypothetical protein
MVINTIFRLVQIILCSFLIIHGEQPDISDSCGTYVFDLQSSDKFSIQKKEFFWIEHDGLFCRSVDIGESKLLFRSNEGRITAYGVHKNIFYIATDNGILFRFNRVSGNIEKIRQYAGVIEDLRIDNNCCYLAVSVTSGEPKMSRILKIDIDRMSEVTVCSISGHISELYIHNNKLFYLIIKGKRDFVNTVSDDLNAREVVVFTNHLYAASNKCTTPGELFVSDKKFKIETCKKGMYLVTDSLLYEIKNNRILQIKTPGIKKLLTVSDTLTVGYVEKELILHNRITGWIKKCTFAGGSPQMVLHNEGLVYVIAKNKVFYLRLSQMHAEIKK